ncbi:pectin lyase fold/virulence factor [Mycena vulgaris]|nr:pectin lyase fold/virulence factor [Mycena vulgaris]
MKSFQLVAAALAVARCAASQSSVVTGTAPSFAAGITGGGNAPTTFIGNINDLKAALTSTQPMNIVIGGTFDFRDSEGTGTFQTCFPYICHPEAGGQGLLNTLGGCNSLPLSSVTIDKAGVEGTNVVSEKTLVKLGTTTKLIGKGLRFVGVSNIIIQNIEITDLNPAYVWGGDALVFTGTSRIWIDHVTGPSDLIIISNSFINGTTTNSATCDGHTYWGLELVGSGYRITFYRNFVSMTSGRSPALRGNTLFHAINNGNAFINTPVVRGPGFVGQLFSSETADLAQCGAALNRDCVANSFTNSGAFNSDQTAFFGDFGSLTIVPAASAASIASSVPASAGNTLPA